MRPVYIIDGARTPFLKARSGPGPFTPVDLAVQCGRPLLLRQPFAPGDFDQVILGCVNVIADEMNPARVAALRLGMGEAMVAFTVQINCGSGMQSIDTGYRYIREGVSDLILAGGSEALSYAPLVWPQAGVRWFDSAFGGVGGHPAKVKYGGGHTGNVCTEDLVNLFESMGISTGINLDGLLATAEFCEQTLGRELYGRVTRSGLTPFR